MRYLWYTRLSAHEPWRFGNLTRDLVEAVLEAAEHQESLQGLSGRCPETCVWAASLPFQMVWSFEEAPPAEWICMIRPTPPL